MAANLPKYNVAVNLNTDDLDEVKTFWKSIFREEQPEDNQTCPICKKKLASEANRDKHIERMHGGGSKPANKNRQKPTKQTKRGAEREPIVNEMLNMFTNNDQAKEPNSKRPKRSTRTVFVELESDDGLGSDTTDSESDRLVSAPVERVANRSSPVLRKSTTDSESNHLASAPEGRICLPELHNASTYSESSRSLSVPVERNGLAIRSLPEFRNTITRSVPFPGLQSDVRVSIKREPDF
ncbi:uncharacterized protein LOC129565163 [Sitodiplosis mosellana]|uniref:uncharacterized protein LOC129565163 n=1 Tax=Sitodiplosis mosellana TaxID=263140 RepID=UPI002444C7D0|nr:uncharacterized protein LOC129565163 [Sitodiplosis mosellana]